MTGPTSDGFRGSLGTDPPLDELRERERRLAEAQRLARTGSWDWDIAADRASWSDELYRILGLEPQEVAASRAELLMRIHPDDVPLVESAVLRARTVNEAYEMRHRIVRADGSVCEVEGRGDAAGEAELIDGVTGPLLGVALPLDKLPPPILEYAPLSGFVIFLAVVRSAPGRGWPSWWTTSLPGSACAFAGAACPRLRDGGGACAGFVIASRRSIGAVGLPRRRAPNMSASRSPGSAVHCRRRAGKHGLRCGVGGH